MMMRKKKDNETLDVFPVDLSSMEILYYFLSEWKWKNKNKWQMYWNELEKKVREKKESGVFLYAACLNYALQS